MYNMSYGVCDETLDRRFNMCMVEFIEVNNDGQCQGVCFKVTFQLYIESFSNFH